MVLKLKSMPSRRLHAEMRNNNFTLFKVGYDEKTQWDLFGHWRFYAELADVCHERGVPLIVDEAHGPHFAFHGSFPQVRCRRFPQLLAHFGSLV